MTIHIPSMPDDQNQMFPDVHVSHDDEWRMLLRSSDPAHEVTIPGMWTLKNSLVVAAGGHWDVNKVTVTFLAASISIDDRVRPDVTFLPQPAPQPKSVVSAQFAVGRLQLQLAEAQQRLAELAGT